MQCVASTDSLAFGADLLARLPLGRARVTDIEFDLQDCGNAWHMFLRRDKHASVWAARMAAEPT